MKAETFRDAEETTMSKKQRRAMADDSVANLLIISLLKDGVNPKVITRATNIPEGTIRRKFPMSLIKPDATNSGTAHRKKQKKKRTTPRSKLIKRSE